MKRPLSFLLTTYLLLLPAAFRAQTSSTGIISDSRILTNQTGYEFNKPKHAILLSTRHFPPLVFDLVDESTHQGVYHGKVVYSGPVDHWKNWQFSTIDFSAFSAPGTYRLIIRGLGAVSSGPFIIGTNVLEKATLSDILYYFKGQRSAGLLDQADHHLPLPPSARNPAPVAEASRAGDTILDLHGGWYDATGDYGIHLSHLSFSSFFNPQQVPFVEYSLLKTYELLAHRPGADYRQFMRRILDEAMYGADYLVRVQADGGSFYRSIGAPGPGKLAKDRVISPEQQS
jgi:hypothetical protein